MRIGGRVFTGLIAIAFTALPCAAVVVYDSAAQNTSSPGGSAAITWDASGKWFAGFNGTAIGPHHFITAQHVGGGIGGQFTLNANGNVYVTDAVYNIPGTDLRIWRVTGTFPVYTPLYTGSDELSKPMYVLGSGVPRGNTPADEVIESSELKGWKWNFTSTQPMSWGQNSVEDIQDISGYGDHLGFGFDAIANQNEATLTGGDSGGGLFIQEGGVWKIAGVNHFVDGQYSLDGSPPFFNASIFDMGGLYVQDYAQEFPNGDDNIPSFAWSSRISSNLESIYATVPELPEPSSAAITLAGAAIIALRRRS